MKEPFGISTTTSTSGGAEGLPAGRGIGVATLMRTAYANWFLAANCVCCEKSNSVHFSPRALLPMAGSGPGCWLMPRWMEGRTTRHVAHWAPTGAGLGGEYFRLTMQFDSLQSLTTAAMRNGSIARALLAKQEVRGVDALGISSSWIVGGRCGSTAVRLPTRLPSFLMASTASTVTPKPSKGKPATRAGSLR